MKSSSIVKNQSHKQYFIVITCLLFVIGILSYSLLINAAKLEHLENVRNKLNSLGTELKESSEELTSCCRIYVVTCDPIWEKKYWEILDIRNGKKTRPDGARISLKDSLIRVGIAKDEYIKLYEAEQQSNDLVMTEKIAFNAMKGIYLDASNQFTVRAKPDTEFAKKIMFDEKYFANKNRIMQPIAEFRVMLATRTAQELKHQHNINNILLGAILVLILIVSIISFYAIVVLRKRIVEQVAELKQSNSIIKTNEEILLRQNAEITALLDNIKSTNTALMELNSTKDKFFSIIAHDLRNPFHLLINMNDIILEKLHDHSDKELKQLVELMHESSEQAYKLLENLLAWARMQTGNIKASPQEVKPSDLINETKRMCKGIAESKSIEIKIDIHCDDIIKVDLEMIKAVLRNLLTNAIKFTYTNGIVTIAADCTDSAVLFTVADTGVGIDQKYINQLFQINNKLTKDGTEGEHGTGLGLILCKEFLEKHNGKIWVESEIGKGSKFMFTIPKV